MSIKIRKRKIRKAKAAVPAPVGMGTATIVRRVVDDPMITDGLLEGQIIGEAPRALDAKGRVLPPGRIEVDIKLSELIGGMARVGARTELQEMSAARYRVLFDRSQVGGARAIDYSAVRVDVTGSPMGLIFEIGEDARRTYREAVQCLGLLGSDRFEKVVCHNMSVRQLQRVIGEVDGHAGWDRTAAMLLKMAEDVSEVFGFKGQGRRSGLRREGAVPTTMPDELIINRVRRHAA